MPSSLEWDYLEFQFQKVPNDYLLIVRVCTPLALQEEINISKDNNWWTKFSVHLPIISRHEYANLPKYRKM